MADEDPIPEETRFGRESVIAHIDHDSRTLQSEGPPPAAREGLVDSVTGRFRPSEEKYEIEGRIGAGGMGEVLLVQDHDLRRQVAMKLMKPGAALTADARLKFVGEAQATSQLEHPGIPPVHDIGVSPDGALYFTMKVVRGRTLRQVLQDLFLGRKEVRRTYTLHRLVSILERVCEAVHFAHEKGVIHRDLKPENLMLGDYGEVHVMDWGIAKIADIHEDDAEFLEDLVETDGLEAGLSTMDGTIKGTLGYMSPEQALGKLSILDRRSDIFALGCILYEMLTLHPAYEGDDILRRVRECEFVPVVRRNPRRPVPEPLEVICRKAMQREPSDRHEDAEEFRLGLRAWLDGTSEKKRRNREAERLAAKGREARERYDRIQAQRSDALQQAEYFEHRMKPWQSVEEVRPVLDARRKVEELRRESVVAFADATHLLNAALIAEEDNATARRDLARLWLTRLREAEAAGDAGAAHYAHTMAERYDDGTVTDQLRGDGSLYLSTDRDGIEVELLRLEDHDGILRPVPVRSLGRTPVGPIDLPMGSYLCLFSAVDGTEIAYPVHIGRNRSWKAHVIVRTAAEVGDGFVFVPGGPFLFGHGRDMEERELPDFAIGRSPVTFGEYAEFLAALEAFGGLEAARARCPGTTEDGPLMERLDDGTWRPLDAVCEGPARERCLAEFGEDFTLRIPVIGVTFDDAEAWCAWKSKETGREWRLPTEEEREKAARGVDGRLFPWGSLELASLSNNSHSRPEDSQPEPVGCYPMATSIYGMRDAAGNVWDWTSSWEDANEVARVLRGGAWHTYPAGVRCSLRHSLPPGQRSAATGFRCARSFG